jgi:hypothetical protein
MAKSASKRKGATRAPSPVSENFGRAFGFGSLRVMLALIEQLGIPGAFMLMGFWFVVKYASPDQKKEVVGMILHPDDPRARPLGFLLLLAILIFVAQQRIWSRRDVIKQREIDRLSAWKTAHQEMLPAKLDHTDPSSSG